MERPGRLRLILILSLAIAAVSCGSIFVRLASAPALAIAAYRVLLATLILSPWVASGPIRELRPLSRIEWGWLLLAGTALGWILIGESVLRDGLVRGPVGQNTIERGRRHAWFALFLYTLLAVAAMWYPRLAASVTSLTWLFWLVSSIRLKHRELEPAAA